MSRWAPCKFRVFISKLRKIGFSGPYSGTRHQFMVYKNHRLSIPSNQEYLVPQLKMLINEIEIIVGRKISIKEWTSL